MSISVAMKGCQVVGVQPWFFLFTDREEVLRRGENFIARNECEEASPAKAGITSPHSQ